MLSVGTRNLISDVDGIMVGHSQDQSKNSGVSVIIPEAPAICAVDVRGGAPGGAENDLLKMENLVDHIDAIIFTGGSVFGLAAHGGVVSFLRDQGRGFRVGDHRIPIVPSAVLFDLPLFEEGKEVSMPDYKNLGFQAAKSAQKDFFLGNVGAGLGAVSGSIKGGVGSASLCFPLASPDEKNITVGAYVAVNSFGSTTMPGQRCFWAWSLERDGEFGSVRPSEAKWYEYDREQRFYDPHWAQAFSNTTLGVVATDMALTSRQALRIAIMAQDGLARAIRPVHTPFDGDTVFALSVGKKSSSISSEQDVMLCGLYAADCMARAVARAIYHARAFKDVPCWHDF